MGAGQENLPTREEVSSGDEDLPPVPKDIEERQAQPNGGEIFGPSDEEVLSSLKEN